VAAACKIGRWRPAKSRMTESRPSKPSGALIVVLCGLPAAGKSTLAAVLFEQAAKRLQNDVRVIIVSFDAVHEQVVSEQKSDATSAPTFDPAIWKQSRSKAFENLERELDGKISGSGSDSKTDSALRMLIVDDNMQYRSMRYAIFQLARKRKSGLFV
jgi:tRNA uridine 5-carbamoylmethylation protein Kti12